MLLLLNYTEVPKDQEYDPDGDVYYHEQEGRPKIFYWLSRLETIFVYECVKRVAVLVSAKFSIEELRQPIFCVEDVHIN